MKILLILVFVFVGFLSAANAQACGQYVINIAVRDEQGKPVKNAAVKLLPIEKDETRGKKFIRDKSDLSSFSISYPEGYSFSSFHKFIISAPGFKPAENKAVFSSCQNRDVTVKLARLNSASSAVWQFENNINVLVLDNKGKYLNGAKLTIIDEKQKSEIFDIKFDSIYLTLPSGEYTFRFEKSGYEIKEVKVDLTPLSGKYLKVELMPKE